MLGRSGVQSKVDDNEPIRRHVLALAAASSLLTVRRAAEDIVARMEEQEALAAALCRLGAFSLKADSESLGRTFATYIRNDVVRLGIVAKGAQPSQAEWRACFAKWKKLYVCPASE